MRPTVFFPLMLHKNGSSLPINRRVNLVRAVDVFRSSLIDCFYKVVFCSIVKPQSGPLYFFVELGVLIKSRLGIAAGW